MGLVRHHALVVVGIAPVPGVIGSMDVSVARTEAIRCGCSATPVVEAEWNGYASFTVTPDGSKENRNASDEGDLARDRFVAWLRANGGFEWVEVEFGRDDAEADVTRHGSDGAS